MYGETRSSPRVACQVRFLGAGATTVRGDLIDLSATGLSLAVEQPLEVGKELHLEFELLAGVVECVAEVRRVVSKSGYFEAGLRFIRISSESLAAIQRTVTPMAGGLYRSHMTLRR